MENGVAVFGLDGASCRDDGGVWFESTGSVVEGEGLGRSFAGRCVLDRDDDVGEAAAFGESDIFEGMALAADVGVGRILDLCRFDGDFAGEADSAHYFAFTRRGVFWVPPHPLRSITRHVARFPISQDSLRRVIVRNTG